MGAWGKGRGLTRRVSMIAVPMNGNNGTRRKTLICEKFLEETIDRIWWWWDMKEHVFGMTWVCLHEAPGRKRLMTRKWNSQKVVATVIPFPSSVRDLKGKGACLRQWKVLWDLWNSTSFPQPQLWNKWRTKRVQRCRTKEKPSFHFSFWSEWQTCGNNGHSNVVAEGQHYTIHPGTNNVEDH